MDPRQLSRRDLRRLVHDMWADPRCNAIAPGALDAAFVSAAKSVERTLVTAYLRHFPVSHPSFHALRQAVSMLAERHDWPWRERGRKWQLWDDARGPDVVAQALLEADDPAAVLRDAGLDGDLAQGEFVGDAIARACGLAMDRQGKQAEACGKRLISLAGAHPAGRLDPDLVRALLWPWRATTPSDGYKKRLLDFLVARFGDPRFQQARWETLVHDIGDGGGIDLMGLLRRWFTERTVRQFFDVVGFTTKDTTQWAERRAFWEGYLDAGLIEDAWFALGTHAEMLIKGKTADLAGNYAIITGGRQYADPTHSSLILSIGELRIAEWSHNGACRFWESADRQAPVPYGRQYSGFQLRAMNGGKGFEHISHMSGWQNRFSAKIHEASGRTHPVFGAGYRTRSYY